ncbi:hypothetical protein, partial [Streptomyces fructofermentans]|uniref:hypothetical protein n=1 Tax=Streptomyces fructofermentans TaxID=152141 RepID=UPI0033E97C66
NGKKNDGKAKESVQVVDVAQLLLESVTTTPTTTDGNDDGNSNDDGGDGDGGADDGEPPAGTAETENTPEPEPVK